MHKTVPRPSYVKLRDSSFIMEFFRDRSLTPNHRRKFIRLCFQSVFAQLCLKDCITTQVTRELNGLKVCFDSVVTGQGFMKTRKPGFATVLDVL
jgi:hypothetical protein